MLLGTCTSVFLGIVFKWTDMKACIEDVRRSQEASVAPCYCGRTSAKRLGGFSKGRLHRDSGGEPLCLLPSLSSRLMLDDAQSGPR